MKILSEISAGELLDKLTILEIKMEKIRYGIDGIEGVSYAVSMIHFFILLFIYFL